MDAEQRIYTAKSLFLPEKQPETSGGSAERRIKKAAVTPQNRFALTYEHSMNYVHFLFSVGE
jgi:hypothetical protein